MMQADPPHSVNEIITYVKTRKTEQVCVSVFVCVVVVGGGGGQTHRQLAVAAGGGGWSPGQRAGLVCLSVCSTCQQQSLVLGQDQQLRQDTQDQAGAGWVWAVQGNTRPAHPLVHV